MDKHRTFFEGLLQKQWRQDSIQSEIREEILYITLNRPKKMNSFSLDMYRKVQNLLNDANVDPSVKAIVLQGEGKLFCSGNDLSNFMLFPPELMDVLF